MDKKKKIVFIVRIVMISFSIACVILLTPWDVLYAFMRPLPNTIQKEVDNATKLGLDGIIVYVDKKGEQPAFYTAGWKDRDNQIPADAESYFKIGSISKLYVAVSYAKLVQEGRLSLDDKLTDYFPEYSGRIDNAEQITLRMMLQHRSGLKNYTDQVGYRWDDPTKTSAEARALIFDKPADFAPNEDYSYSNTNYLLLRDILDKVLGYSHTQYIKEEILDPFGLESTFFSVNDVDIEDVMSGYYVGAETDFKSIDAGMIATAEDVGKFVRALNDGTLLSEEEERIYSSIYEYEHTGWVLGYYSIAKYQKDIDTVVVQFVNTNGGSPLLNVFDTQGGTKVTVSDAIYNRIVRILRK